MDPVVEHQTPTQETRPGQAQTAAGRFAVLPPAMRLVIAGGVSGFMAILSSAAYALLIFSAEPLAAYRAQAIGLALFSGLVLSLLLSFLSASPGMVAFPQPALIPLLALLSFSVVSSFPEGAAPEVIFATTAAAQFVATLLMAAALLLLGQFRLGRLFRFLPYPVLGGFLAGLGWVLLKTGLDFMAGQPVEKLLGSNSLCQPQSLTLLVGAVLGLLFFLLQRGLHSPLTVPAALVLSLCGFLGTAFLLGFSPASLQSAGWLVGPLGNAPLWNFPGPLLAPNPIQPDALAGQLPIYFSIVFVALVGVLASNSEIEDLSQVEMDMDAEIKAAGMANLVAGLGGGLPGYASTSLSAMPRFLQLSSRGVGLVVAALFAAALWFGGSFLSYLPLALVGALAVHLGLSRLFTWLVQNRHQMPGTDYYLMLGILALIVFLGPVAGILVGILATSVLFAINYSRINIVRNRLTGSTYQSNVDRSAYLRQKLAEHAQQILAIKLQGFIFFGTAYNLYQEVVQRLEDAALPPLRFLVFDFNLVNGVDSSGLNSFNKLRYLAEQQDFYILFCDPAPDVEERLRTGAVLDRGTPKNETPRTQIFSGLDFAMEWCENKILNMDTITLLAPPPLAVQLAAETDGKVDFSAFVKKLEKKYYRPGEVLIEPGQPPGGVFFIEQGQVSARLVQPDGEIVRLRTMGDGTIVGELGMYLGDPPKAQVVANVPTIAYFLSRETLQAMQSADPELASAFHRYIATVLSRRLMQMNATVKALMD